jgi:hypothetical protein
MSRTRRNVLSSLLSASLAAGQRPFPEDQEHKPPSPPGRNEDEKLPNGKSMKNAIAKQNYEQSLRDADEMVEAAQSLRDDLRKAGTYVVSVSSLRKTEEIERLARKIRGRLKS